MHNWNSRSLISATITSATQLPISNLGPILHYFGVMGYGEGWKSSFLPNLCLHPGCRWALWNLWMNLIWQKLESSSKGLVILTWVFDTVSLETQSTHLRWQLVQLCTAHTQQCQVYTQITVLILKYLGYTDNNENKNMRAILTALEAAITNFILNKKRFGTFSPFL